MDAEGMENLQDGVNKLAEFSSVLSSVTRALDKNVRRLEDQFGKANTQLKVMKDVVDENASTVSRLKHESDDQLHQVQAAIRAATNESDPIEASSYMVDEAQLKATLTEPAAVETATKLLASAIQSSKQSVMVRGDASTEVPLQTSSSWNVIALASNTPERAMVDQAVNQALHKLTKTLSTKKEHNPSYSKLPQISEKSTAADAMNAIIQRLYRLENAVALQSSVNEALVKSMRDDTYLRTAYTTLLEHVAGLESHVKELIGENARMNGTISSLRNTLLAYEESMADIAKGGKLRLEKRKRRVQQATVLDEDGFPIAGDKDEEEGMIEWGLDSYTVEESDALAAKLQQLEASLSSSGGMAVKIKRLDANVDELAGQMEMQQEATKKLIQANEENTSGAAKLNKMIFALKSKWSAIATNISFGLDHFSDLRERGHNVGNKIAGLVGSGGEDNDDASANSEVLPPFVEALSNFLDLLNNSMLAFEPRDSIDSTLDILSPKLDELTVAVDNLLRLDQEGRFAAMEGKSSKDAELNFSDVLCADRTTELKSYLMDAYQASIPIIDERVDKISIRRRMEKVEMNAANKGDISKLKKEDKELRKLLEKKAEAKEVLEMQTKTVTIKKLQAFKEALANQLDLDWDVFDDDDDEGAGEEQGDDDGNGEGDEEDEGGRGRDYYGSIDGVDGGEGGGGGGEQGEGGAYTGKKGGKNGRKKGGKNAGKRRMAMAQRGLRSGGEEINKRIDMILLQMQDLKTNHDLLVPRDEVQEAMTAVLREVKLMKMNLVNVNRFKEGLDTKADAEEMRKMVEALSVAVGGLMGTNVSAMAKTKCLLCDKPVAGIIKTVVNPASIFDSPTKSSNVSPPRGTNNNNQREPAAVFDDESQLSNSAPRPNSSVARLSGSASLSKLAALEKKEADRLAKATSEVTILRTVLPAMDQQPSGSSPTSRAPAQSYKQRIRSSAGGGGGPDPTQNTR